MCFIVGSVLFIDRLQIVENPEYCTVAPRNESTMLPINPAVPPITITGHLGGWGPIESSIRQNLQTDMVIM